MNVFSFSTRNMIVTLAIVSMLIGFSQPAQASFGDIQAGARSMGMGGAFVGLADDASAPLFNPAGIGQFQKLDLLLNYTALNSGLTVGSLYTGYVGVVVPTQTAGSFGIGLYQRGASIGSENLFTESVLALNYARGFNQLYFGLTAKALMASWNDVNGAVTLNPYFNGDDGKSSFDVDAGILYTPFRNLALGLAVENLMATDMAINTDLTEDKLDRVLKTGVAFRLGERLSPYALRYPGTFVADINYKMRGDREAVSRIQVGAEGWFAGDGILGLRAGFATGDEDYQAVTAGASFRIKPIHPGLQLDYAYQAPMGDNLDGVATHRIALRFNNVPVIKSVDASRVNVGLTADPMMFSPNMDGRMDVTRLRPTAPNNIGVQSWAVRIYTKTTGSLIQVFEGQGMPPTELTWRGKDQNGMDLPDGEYQVVHEVATAMDGVFVSPRITLIVDTTPPEVFARATPQTFMPLNDTGLPAITTFKLSANDAVAGTDAWSLFIRHDGSNEDFRVLTGRGAPAEDVTWDGTNATGTIEYEGGSYVYVLEAVDKVGNRAWTEPSKVFTSTSVKAGPSTGTMQMVHEKVHFDFDQATIKPESLPILDRIVRELEKFPDYSMVISAHTDAKGSDEYNLALSQRRAEAVMQYLQSRGALTRVVDAKGYGESRPLATNDTEEGRAINRRVEMVLVPRGEGPQE